MKKGMFLALALSVLWVASAAATPAMLSGGHKSLGFQADTSTPTIQFGWNITDMTKVQAGGGWRSERGSYDEGDVEPESETAWSFNAGISRYMNLVGNDMFAPFFGGELIIESEPVGTGGIDRTNYGFRGFFGVEAFVIESLSFGGNVGVTFQQKGDIKIPGDPVENGERSVTTASSAITANLYW
jgi:hypothetical protein